MLGAGPTTQRGQHEEGAVALLELQPSSSLAPLMTAVLQVVSANLSAQRHFGCRPRGLRLRLEGINGASR